MTQGLLRHCGESLAFSDSAVYNTQNKILNVWIKCGQNISLHWTYVEKIFNCKIEK